MPGLTMHGRIDERPGGKPVHGAMSSGQIRDWVLGKLDEYKADGKKMTRATSVGQAVNDFMAGKKKSTNSFFQDKRVWHASAGKKTDPSAAKCTLFFVVADEANGVGRIVGIGTHKGSASYDILWKANGWVMGSTIDLTDG